MVASLEVLELAVPYILVSGVPANDQVESGITSLLSFLLVLY